MEVSIAVAKNRLPALIRAVEGGEAVIITRRGKPVAQIALAPVERQPVKWGGMADRIHLPPGWDAPVDLEQFMAGSL